MEAVGLINGVVVELQQVAAGQILWASQALGVGVALTVCVGVLGGHGAVAVVGVNILVELLHIGDVHRVAVDVVLFAEQIGAAVLAVIVQVHPVAVGAVCESHLGGQIFKQLIVHLGGVAIAGQQYPGLALLAQAQQVALAVGNDVVGRRLRQGQDCRNRGK